MSSKDNKTKIETNGIPTYFMVRDNDGSFYYPKTVSMKCPNPECEEREKLTMPNREKVLAKVIRKNEPAIKCLKCGHKFEPRSHEKLTQALDRVAKRLGSV